MAQQTMEKPMNDTQDMFKSATESFKNAMDAGVRFQQDAFRSMTECFTEADSIESGRGKVETAAVDSIEMIRKNAEQTQKCFDDSCRTGMDMFKKGCEISHADRDMFAKTRDMWMTAFDAMKTTVETTARMSTQSIENWASFCRKNMTMGEPRKSAK